MYIHRDPVTGEMHDDPECRCVERHGRVKCDHCGIVVLWCRSYTMSDEPACVDCGYANDPYFSGGR
jgi:hypothetical protein